MKDSLVDEIDTEKAWVYGEWWRWCIHDIFKQARRAHKTACFCKRVKYNFEKCINYMYLKRAI